MTKIVLRPGEPIDRAVRRFKKQCNVAGIIDDMKQTEHYVKPSVEKRERRKKSIAGKLKDRRQAFKNKAKMKKRKRLGLIGNEVQES